MIIIVNLLSICDDIFFYNIMVSVGQMSEDMTVPISFDLEGHISMYILKEIDMYIIKGNVFHESESPKLVLLLGRKSLVFPDESSFMI